MSLTPLYVFAKKEVKLILTYVRRKRKKSTHKKGCENESNGSEENKNEKIHMSKKVSREKKKIFWCFLINFYFRTDLVGKI